MSEKKKLVTETEYRTAGKIVDRVCKVQIFKQNDSGKYEVILTEPDDPKYLGISTTNYFEFFATKIKAKLLPNVPAEDIEWFDLMKWKYNSFEDQLLRVFMDWNGNEYQDPRWAGANA